MKKLFLLTILIVFILTGCHKKPYNPYLHDKTKLSQIEAGKAKNADKKAAKAYKKQLRKTSMKLYNRKPGPSPSTK